MPNFLQNIGGKIDQGHRNIPQPVPERIMRQAMSMNSGQPYGAALGQRWSHAGATCQKMPPKIQNGNSGAIKTSRPG